MDLITCFFLFQFRIIVYSSITDKGIIRFYLRLNKNILYSMIFIGKIILCIYQ